MPYNTEIFPPVVSLVGYEKNGSKNWFGAKVTPIEGFIHNAYLS